MHSSYDIAAYVWPAFTGDEPRTRIFWPQGMGEWESVHSAEKKFEGHSWPRRPLWGYVNEADPYVMEMEINAAADHGVNTFIYDWYWYNNQPFLEQCLNNGFLKARNNHRMKFYLMWANHDVGHGWDKRNAHLPWADLWSAQISEVQFRAVVDRWIDRYFLHPSYYRIDGKPVLQIYYLNNFIVGVGGMENARRSVDYLQERAIAAGLPGIHLQVQHLRERNKNKSGFDDGVVGVNPGVLRTLGFDSVTHYQFASYSSMSRPYPEIVQDALREWDFVRNETGITYFPHVTIGWDNNPRYLTFRPDITTENTPEQFELALRAAKQYVDTHNSVPLITINSWNEWTETSYLEPDNLYGYGYLEAVRRVFLPDSNH